MLFFGFPPSASTYSGTFSALAEIFFLQRIMIINLIEIGRMIWGFTTAKCDAFCWPIVWLVYFLSVSVVNKRTPNLNVSFGQGRLQASLNFTNIPTVN
jgi:hypothetical protein